MAVPAKKSYKIVLLGEGRVGKTSILLRYVRGEFVDKYAHSQTVTNLGNANRIYCLKCVFKIGSHIPWSLCVFEIMAYVTHCLISRSISSFHLFGYADNKSPHKRIKWTKKFHSEVIASLCIYGTQQARSAFTRSPRSITETLRSVISFHISLPILILLLSFPRVHYLSTISQTGLLSSECRTGSVSSRSW